MDSINQIGKLASGILEYEFDFIEDLAEKKSELLTISGSLSGKIGELNILLNQNFCFTGADGNPCPRLGDEESAILEEMYLRDYNTKQARRILRGTYDITVSGIADSSATLSWTELREGDTTIKRPASAVPGSYTNRVDLSKNFKAMADESEKKIKDLVYAYNLYGATPRQVAGTDAPDINHLSYPSKSESTCAPSLDSVIEPTGIEPTGIEPTGIGPTGVEPSGVEPSGIEPSGFKYSDFTGIDLINDYRVAFNIEFIENNGGGEVEYPESPFIPGEEIKLNPKPEFGYEFQYWSGIEPSGLNITEQGIFEMPRSNVIISGYYI